MSVFAHKNDKSKFDLGNEADLTGIGDGTPFGAIKEINSDLSVFSFRVDNNVPQFSIDGGTTWINLGGGSAMQKNYVFIGDQSIKIDISALNDATTVTIGGYYSGTGATSKSEVVSIATVKTWTTTHNLVIYSQAQLSAIYSDGVLELKSSSTMPIIGTFTIND